MNFVSNDNATTLMNAIESKFGTIATEFDDATAYSTGDIVFYQRGLYKFKEDHAAGSWDASEVDSVTVTELLEATEPDPLTTAQINALLAILG